MRRSEGTDRLTVSEVAAELECSERTVKRFIKDGELPAYKIHSRKTFVLREDLDEFVESRRTTPAGANR